MKLFVELLLFPYVASIFKDGKILKNLVFVEDPVLRERKENVANVGEVVCQENLLPLLQLGNQAKLVKRDSEVFLELLESRVSPERCTQPMVRQERKGNKVLEDHQEKKERREEMVKTVRIRNA